MGQNKRLNHCHKGGSVKLYRREEIVRALGLETRRRSELTLLLILERLQSETLAGEQRSAVLKDLIGQYAEVLRIRSGLRPSRTQRDFQVFVYRQAEIWLELRTLAGIAADVRNIKTLLSRRDIEEINKQIDTIATELDNHDSNEQRRRAKGPREPTPFMKLIFKLLEREPNLSTYEVEQRLRARVGGGVIDDIDNKTIFLSPTERNSTGSMVREYREVKLKNLATTVSRAKKVVRKRASESASL
jgi:hypothetical protein